MIEERGEETIKKRAKGLTIIITAIVVMILMNIESGHGTQGVTPYFTAINNTLLPFRETKMPIFNDGVLYVAHDTFTELGINSISSTEMGMVHLYKGNKYVDFYETENITVDQDGRVREGVSARRWNGTYYLPLGVVGSYFELQYKMITHEPISIVRIMSNEAVNTGGLINEKSFLSVHRNAMQGYAKEYNEKETEKPEEEAETSEPEEIETPDPPEETVAPPAPTYEDVQIYMSFTKIRAGQSVSILDALAAPGYRSCFFVSAEDIEKNAGEIRRISGNGHTIGIWLEEGTNEEYEKVTRLLFEACKIKTVLAASGEGNEQAKELATEKKLEYWEATREYSGSHGEQAKTITSQLPTGSGTRYSLRLECTEEIAKILPEVLSYLRKNEYSVEKITETIKPVTS